MWKNFVTLLTILAVGGVPSLFAADAPALVPITCASPTAAVKVVAKVPPSAVSARVYFKEAGEANEHYIDLRPGADGTVWGFLPAPESDTKTFTYRLVTTDGQKAQIASSTLTASVSSSCPAPTYTAQEQKAASNIVVGLSADEQSAVPPGFQCEYVVSYLTVAGELRDNDGCRKPAGLFAHKKLLALAAVGLVGTGVIIERKEDKCPVSPSRPCRH